jgi:hypothetical protein
MSTAQPTTEAEAAGGRPKSPFEDSIPEPFQVLGLRLLPLSIGRFRRLARHDCAFVAPGAATAGLSDLMVGVLICSMRCDEFDEFCVSPTFSREVARWSRKVMPEPWLSHLPQWLNRLPQPLKLLGAPLRYASVAAYAAWSPSKYGAAWRERHAVDVAVKCTLFRSYIELAQRLPRIYSKAGEAKMSTAHWADNLETILRSELNWSSEEVNEQPLSKALADWCQWACANDVIGIATDEDVAAAEHNDRQIQAALAAWQEGRG